MTRVMIFLLLLATSASGLKARTVTGRVLVDADSTALTGAGCRLLDGEKFLKATTTNTEGIFSLETDVRSSLTLEITMMGFTSTEVTIEPGGKNINLGDIYLSQGVELGEVTVEGKTITDVKGRTIVYPATSDIKASSTTLSLFQKLPLAGLNANPVNRTLTVDGGTPMILINGIPSTMDDVNAIQPKDIEKIEFTRVTPARYADKGTSGVISITLKKRADGGQVYLWGRSAVNTAFLDGNLRASYHQGPSQFTLAYSPSWRHYNAVYDTSDESYIGDDFRVDIKSHDRNPFNYDYHNMRAKYDYSPNTGTLFSATFSATPLNSRRRLIGETQDSELGEYSNYNRASSHDFAPSLDLFLRREFNEKNSLELQVVGSLSSSDYRRDNRYTFAGGNEENYMMNVDSRRRSLISEVSYTHEFSERTSLSGGVQNTISHSKNTYQSSDYKPVLKENNNYVYARLGQQIGKVYLAAATGMKLYWIENDMNKRHFIRNLSSVNLSWNIDSRWSMQGVFRYSPGIPSLSSLTDYPQQTSPYLIQNGNPELKVSETFLYNLEGTFQYKKFYVTWVGAYVNVKNAVINDVTYVGDGMFLNQSVNARSYTMFSNTLSTRITGIYGFGMSLSGELSHYRTAGSGWTNTLTSFHGYASLWWNKGPWTLSYWRVFPGKSLSGNIVEKNENADYLGCDFKPDKHWNIGVAWMFMFERKGTRYPSWSYSKVNPAVRDRYIPDNVNMAVLTVSYSADFGSIFRTGRRSLNNTDSGSSLLKM